MNRWFNIATGMVAVVMAGWIVPPVAGQAPANSAGKPVPGKAVKAGSGTSANKWTTPWGDPDLQGVWNDSTSTPLQRPGSVGSKDVLTDQEAAEFQNQLASELTRDRRDGDKVALITTIGWTRAI
jgi:hypothetical protein